MDLIDAKIELAAQVVRNFGGMRMFVQGESMLPSIHPGDELKVERCTLSQVEPGQVVLYTRGRELVAHRVIRRSASTILTRGDSLPYLDPAVPAGQLLGRVTEVTRRGRKVDPRLTVRSKGLAWILRRSGLSARIYMRLVRRPSNKTVAS